MTRSEIFDTLKNALVSLDQDAVVAGTGRAVKEQLPPLEIIEQGLLPGLNVIGEQFESEEVFLPELMQSAMIFQAAMDILQPIIKERGTATRKRGVVVLGTVKGDMHYIGKNIFRLLLETSGFEVHDLGVDVDPFKFIAKADEVHAHIIALSALLTTTLVGQKDVIEALDGQGKRTRYKVMVGGGAVTPQWAAEIGADGYAETAYAGVDLAARLVA